jgi:hypothetical protein
MERLGDLLRGVQGLAIEGGNEGGEIAIATEATEATTQKPLPARSQGRYPRPGTGMGFVIWGMSGKRAP